MRMFVHAIRSTSPAAANAINKGRRALPTRCSRSGSTRASQPAFVARNLSASAADMPSISPRASLTPTPSAKWAMTRKVSLLASVGRSLVVLQVADGPPQLGPRRRHVRFGRHHTDDRDRRAVQGDGATDDGALASPNPLPQPVANQRNMTGARHFVGRFEVAPEHRLEAEHTKEVRRHGDGFDALDAIGLLQRPRTLTVERDLVECAAVLTPEPEIGHEVAAKLQSFRGIHRRHRH